MYRALAAVLCAACASTPAAPASSGDDHTTPSQPEAVEAEGATDPSSQLPPLDETPGAPPEGPPPGAQSLPAIQVRNVGLHVGGGPNDTASKRPFLEAIERHFPEFLRCYRLVADPGQEGTFGVDLHVARAGGTARVEQPRTGLVGDEFRACMVSTFGKVQFEPVKNPLVISYSVRFSIER